MAPLYRYICNNCKKGLEYLQKYSERALTVDCPLCNTKGSLEPLTPVPNVIIHMEDGSSEATDVLKEEDFIFIEDNDNE